MQRRRPAPPPRSGIGFRTQHRAELLETRSDVGFLEIHAENFMGGGKRRADLLQLRRDYPVSIHGVGLSLGSVERPDEDHLKRLTSLVTELEPMLVSDHLSFSRVGDDYLNDLLPLPMTPLALKVVCRNVDIVQQRLGRQILIENPSRYLSFKSSTIPEPEFLNQLAKRSGCGLLLDLNNVHVTCANVGGNALSWCNALRMSAVGEIHVAGHSRVQADGETLLIDDHGSAVAEPVWRLLDYVSESVSSVPVLVEWDSRLPTLALLAAQAAKADRRRARAVTTQPSVPSDGDCLAYAT